MSVGRGNLEQMLYQRDIEIYLFYRKQQKMRKAITHFLATGSAGVLRYQSKLQDKAKRSEGLGCDYKTYFSGQVFNHQVNGVLQDTGVKCPLWEESGTRSQEQQCLQPPSPEERFQFKSSISVKTIKQELCSSSSCRGSCQLS